MTEERTDGASGASAPTYYEQTQYPLTCLVFLLPLVVLYEVGTIWLAPHAGLEAQPQVGAHVLVQLFIGLFGATTYYMPGLLVVAILLAWHVAARRPWQVRPRTIGLMAVESVLLAVPLLVFQDSLQAGLTAPPLRQWASDALLSVGAGVYEELVFRLALISLGTAVLVEGFKVPRNGSLVAVVLIAAGLFASYHHVWPAAEPFAMTRFLFRTGAGIYLGGVFVLRGFGIAAGCHAVYNLMVVTLDLAAPG
jgi:hypothetical protein